MKNNHTAVLFLALVLGSASAPIVAQEHTSAPSIPQETLDQYRAMYSDSPLCSKGEITLWTCTNKKRTFSLCSSQTASRTTGYLQYRASNDGKLAFSYPAVKAPPLGLFEYNLAGNGDAYVEFTNNGYHYTLIDPLRSTSVIRVSPPGASAKETEITCGPNQSLQINFTMRLMSDFGLSERD
jgi:hypothetical protein